MSIFKAYDIRGKYPEEVNEEIFSKIAKTCIKLFKPKKVLIGRDGRMGSESLANSLINTFLFYGVNVCFLGEVSTSTFNFAMINGNFDLHLQVTASHNPKEYNGLKIYDKFKNLIILNENEIIDNLEISLNEKGKLEDGSYYKNKHLFFLKEKSNFKNLKFAVDFSNGVGSIVFYDLIKNENCIILNKNIDGNFPCHEPEPNKENLKELSKVIKENKLDFGIAFDGDADRIVFLDENGEIIDGELISYIFIKYLNPKKFVYEVSFSEFFKEELKKRKIVGLETAVGRTLLNKVKQENADIGAERSNHFYFKECNYLEDAFYTFIKISNILFLENKKISELYSDYPKIFFENCKIKINENNKKEIINTIEEYSKKYKTEKLDGIKFIFDDLSTCLIRFSNTEPILRISISGKLENFSKIKEFTNEIISLIEKFKN
ncbi:MAG: hypothetical protein QXY18_06205 [Nitrososphaerota archaeon]|nr:hypothetical protein [Candidatus Aenigmarchaeota archaeon]